MMARIFRFILMMMIVNYAYKNRFKLMNWLLEKENIRMRVVNFSLKIPALRKLFIQSAFLS